MTTSFWLWFMWRSRILPHNILFPGVFLAVTVLAVNMLGDGLRDTLDPRVRKRL